MKKQILFDFSKKEIRGLVEGVDMGDIDFAIIKLKEVKATILKKEFDYKKVAMEVVNETMEN